MSLGAVLDRLEDVRQTGPGRFLARCPAHEDRHPSLTLRETDEGLILARCWSGCSFTEIVAAIGLQVSAFFPKRAAPPPGHRFAKRPFPVSDVLAAIADEALVAGIAARDIAGGVVLQQSEISRLFIASGRLLAAADYARG